MSLHSKAIRAEEVLAPVTIICASSRGEELSFEGIYCACGEPVWECKPCIRAGFYGLRCRNERCEQFAKHNCASPKRTLSIAAKVAKQQKRVERQRYPNRNTRLRARRREAGRCTTCGWSAPEGAIVYRAGLCERHYAMMVARRIRHEQRQANP